jgi:hypothetical protein
MCAHGYIKVKERVSSVLDDLFGKDVDSWQRFARNVDAGAVLWSRAPVAVSDRLSFTAKGMAGRGTHAVLAMTRRTAHCGAPTGAGLSFDLTHEANRRELANPPEGRS